MAELVLHVKDIDERGKDYDFELTPSWLDAVLSDTPLRRDPHSAGGSLHVHAQRNGSEILLTGEVDAKLTADCARCLQDVPFDAHASITALLCPSGGELPAELELSAEDLDRVPFTGNELVLDDLVREHLLLETPMQPLCSPDCQGIAIPGALRPRAEDFGDGTTDPRLLPLQKLRAKLSGNQGSGNQGSGGKE